MARRSWLPVAQVALLLGVPALLGLEAAAATASGGATGPPVSLKKDVGHRLRVRVAAWNGAGRTTSTSAPTAIIKR
jgi:hypothetical protein